MTDPYARYTRLKFDRPHAKVLRITMENGRMNTTDAALHAELGDIWRDVDRDASVNAVILTAAGKVFSAGGDFAVIQENIDDFAARARQWKEARDIVYNVVNCGKPVVSAMRGVAVGAGARIPRLHRTRGQGRPRLAPRKAQAEFSTRAAALTEAVHRKSGPRALLRSTGCRFL